MAAEKTDKLNQRAVSIVVVHDRGQAVTARTLEPSIEVYAEQLGLGVNRPRPLTRFGGLPANSSRIFNDVRGREPNVSILLAQGFGDGTEGFAKGAAPIDGVASVADLPLSLTRNDSRAHSMRCADRAETRPTARLTGPARYTPEPAAADLTCISPVRLSSAHALRRPPCRASLSLSAIDAAAFRRVA